MIYLALTIGALLLLMVWEKRQQAQERQVWREERTMLLNAARNPKAPVSLPPSKPRAPKAEQPPPDAVALAQIGQILNTPSKTHADA